MGRDFSRALSPVVGVILMVAITILLAATVGMMLDMDHGLFEKKQQFDDAVKNDRVGSIQDVVVAIDDDPGESSARYGSNVDISSGADTVGNSLNSIEITFGSNGPDFSNIGGKNDILQIGIDNNGDGTIDTDLEYDVECCYPDDGVIISNGGRTLRIELSGNYTIKADDGIVLVLGGSRTRAMGNIMLQ